MFPTVGEIDKVNAFGQVVERDFVGGVPPVYGGLPASTVVGGTYPPTIVGGLPTSTVVGGVPPTVYGGVPAYPGTTSVVGGFGEIDKVNAFGQVVERDFIGGSRVLGGFPTVAGLPATTAVPTTAAYAGLPGTTVMAPPMTTPTVNAFGQVVGGVGEIDKVNAFGQVVERDFIGGSRVLAPGFPATSVVGGVAPASTVVAPPYTTPYTTPYAAPYTAPYVAPGYAPTTVVSGSYAPPVVAAAPAMAPPTTVVSGSYAPPVVGAPFVSGSYAPPVYAAPSVYGAAPYGAAPTIATVL